MNALGAYKAMLFFEVYRQRPSKDARYAMVEESYRLCCKRHKTAREQTLLDRFTFAANGIIRP